MDQVDLKIVLVSPSRPIPNHRIDWNLILVEPGAVGGFEMIGVLAFHH